MKIVEIVTHCWAGQYTHFASALHYQLSSLVLYPPKDCEVQSTVCWLYNDKVTEEVINTFLSQRSIRIKSVVFRDPLELGRRSIGRNYAAKGTGADIVWFADADYLFREGCLDHLVSLPWPGEVTMVYPRSARIASTHGIGDKMLARDREGRLLDIDPKDFISHGHRKAIGGVQIVRGDFARRHGYLNGQRPWSQPAKSPFADFHDDIAYRRYCLGLGQIVGVELPNVFRIRHTTTTYEGPKAPAEASA